jgi:hypothetical protein
LIRLVAAAVIRLVAALAGIQFGSIIAPAAAPLAVLGRTAATIVAAP